LQIHLAPRTDLTVAQVLVQNRVSLALPTLPDTLKNAGVSVKAYSPRPLLFVGLLSPDGSRSALELGSYAAAQIQDQLSRLPGVGTVSRFGGPDYCLRIYLDPDRLAARNLTARDVIGALREQRAQVEGGNGGPVRTSPAQALSYTITNLSRMVWVDDF